MYEFIHKLLPRIKQYSESLDKKELFVDQPWIFIDPEGRRHQYIFRRDGKLIISLNGNAQIGSWEHIAAAKSLLVDRIRDKVLLNQGFVQDAIMVLRMDGQRENMVLINERIIPDLNIEPFLTKFLDKQENTSTIQLSDGNHIVLYPAPKGEIWPIAKINGEPAQSGTYSTDSILLYITDGKVVRQQFIKRYSTNLGLLTIHQRLEYQFGRGDAIFFKNEPHGLHEILSN